MKTTFLVGMIGFLLSIGVLTVSVLLPIVNGPRTSWSEAAIGIVPGAIGSFVFLTVMLVGLFLMLNSAQKHSRSNSGRRRSRQNGEEEDEEVPSGRPPSKRRRE